MKKLVFLLILTGCGSLQVKPEIDYRNGYMIYQDTRENIQKFCEASGVVNGSKKIYGCYVPLTRTIAFEKDNWCIGFHEALHALIGRWHKEPTMSCK